MIHTVGIGEVAISGNSEDRIITHALGSCVAVTVYCKTNKVAGMIHIALPSRPSATTHVAKVGYYADEGLEYLIETIQNQYKINIYNASVHIIGGANPSISKDIFMIGVRNLQAVKSYLGIRNISYIELDVGGTVSRTVELNVNDGLISIKRQPLII